MMGPIMEQPLIHQDFQHKYTILVSMFDQELDQAKVKPAVDWDGMTEGCDIRPNPIHKYFKSIPVLCCTHCVTFRAYTK